MDRAWFGNVRQLEQTLSDLADASTAEPGFRPAAGHAWRTRYARALRRASHGFASHHHTVSASIM